MHLRPYQRQAVAAVLADLPANPVLVCPTGGGKTVMGAELVSLIHEGAPSAAVYWLAHREELIEQAAGTLNKFGLSTGIIKAGHPTNYFAQVQVASVQTLARRVASGADNIPPAAAVIVDECHHATAATYRSVLNQLQVPQVGLTATPFRLDGSGLGDIFGSIVVAAYIDDLIRDGYLHAPTVYAGASPDMHGVKLTAGEFNSKQADNAINTPKLVGDIVATWERLAPGRRSVCFAQSIEHSKNICEAFQSKGHDFYHVDGSMPSDQRARLLMALRRGDITGISNCAVLTEGWDLPALECAVLARPTASLNLHLQTVGRILRVAEDKDGCIVLDHAGNHYRHGFVTRRIEYSLDARDIAERSEPLGLRRCQACQLLFEPVLTACPACGAVVQVASREGARATAGELVVVAGFDYRREVWSVLEAQREAKGYAPGWAAYRYKEMFGDWPVVVEGALVDPERATRASRRAVYKSLLRTAQENGFKLGWASVRYRDFFGCWPSGFVGEVKEELGIVEDTRAGVRARLGL